MQLKFSLQVRCDELAYVAFELPEGARAASPASVYHGNAPAYRVRNGVSSEQGPNEVETPFNAIQFNAKSNYALSGGQVDTFAFNLTQADFQALSTMRVRATLRSEALKGNENNISGSQQVVFDLNACSPPTNPGACVIQLEEASFAFAGATDNGDGTTTVRLRIANKLPADVSSVMIETMETTADLGVAGMNNGGVYKTADFQYKTTIDQEANLIVFQGQQTNGYANGTADVFAIIVPTDLYELSPYFQMTVNAGGTLTNTGLNTISCEDEPITPLPVELVSFEGKATASGIALTWTTASEENNDRFEVERSKDGNSFSAVGEVQGAGNSSVTQRYSFTDASADAGQHYYRLKQVDYDGQFEYSKVIAVERAALAGASMEVYPNPATSNYIRVATPGGSDAILQIMDRNGRTVHTQRLAPEEREVQLTVSDLNIPKGLYYVHLQNASGKQTQKLIIQ